MSRNRAIGINNRLPWNLPEDLAWFKQNTLGKPIIMGRKTWESLPYRPLPGRMHFIVSRDADYQAVDHKNNRSHSQVIIADSIEQAIEQAAATKAEEVFFIGGENIYRQAIDHCERMYITQIEQFIDGDAYFPEFKPEQWSIIKKISQTKNESHEKLNYSFNIYQRK